MTDLGQSGLGDLASCDREPIHIPGAVQGHGVLLAVSEPDHVVRMTSANSASLLGVGPERLLGQRLADVLAGDLVPEEVAADRMSDDPAQHYPLSTTLLVDGRPRDVDVLLHRSGGLLVIELEPGTAPPTTGGSYLLTRAAAGRINRASGPGDLYRIAVEEISRLTGFDRVMVYRFDEEWNGEVVAEQKADGLNSFLDLRYPASDIPAQARELYRRNWVRLIADVGYRPVPLVPTLNPLTDAPLDLSHAALRSVSPVHIEYLGNMGVSASMSISLLDRGELWGLIACHHYSGPHRPSYEVRAAAEFLGQLLSLRLVEGAHQQETRHAYQAREALASLKAAVQLDSRPAAESLTQGNLNLLHLVRAQGAVLSLEGVEASIGNVPPAGVVHALVDHARAGGHDVLALEQVPADLPDLAAHRELACGALVMRLSDGQYVVWLRPELVHVVAWGGDPYNTEIAVREGDDVRISPRKSFERWQETVRGRSEQWTADDVRLATELRHSLVDALYARSQRLAATASTLQRGLMPDRIPEVPGWSLAAQYRPSTGGDVGGDWYDVMTLPGGHVVLVLGDVAGHGITAVGTMAQLRNGLRAYLVEDSHPAPVLERLSRLTEQLLPEVFATATVVVLDPATGDAEITSAGHPPPALVTPEGEAGLVAVTPGAPLGISGDSAFTAAAVRLDPGASLVLYSDGLVERRSEAIDVGLARLVRLSADTVGADRLCLRLIEDCRDPDGEDDATVLVLRRAGEGTNDTGGPLRS